MSVKVSCIACGIVLALATQLARAKAPCADDDIDCETAATASSADKEEAESEIRVVNASGLVPLSEVNRQPYNGLWTFDWRLHNYEFGVSLAMFPITGSVDVPLSTGAKQSTSIDDTSVVFAGLYGSYWLPVVGYTPNLAIGLAPQLHADIGGTDGGTTSSDTDPYSEKKLGSALALSTYAMLRVGGHASRYGHWPIFLGGGLGVSLISFNTGQPMKDSDTYVTPAIRVEAGYSFFKVGIESALGSHKTYSSADSPLRLAYHAQFVTLTLLQQPDPED